MNPKDAQATQEGKVRLDLLEPAGNTAIARALEFGAITKGYGVQNYLQVPISARVYLAAMQRHLDALKRCEDLAPDSLVHHLGHIGANVHIWLAAEQAGTFVDDRGPAEVGPNPFNKTAPDQQAAKVTVGFRPDPALEIITTRGHGRSEAVRLLKQADVIVDRMERHIDEATEGTLTDREDEVLIEVDECPADTPMGSCSPTCGDPACEAQWATEEEREGFWQDISRPASSPKFSLGDFVNIAGRRRAFSSGRIVGVDLGSPQPYAVKVNPRLTLWYRADELERAS